jgi:hypothetical protein
LIDENYKMIVDVVPKIEIHGKSEKEMKKKKKNAAFITVCSE